MTSLLSTDKRGTARSREPLFILVLMPPLQLPDTVHCLFPKDARVSFPPRLPLQKLSSAILDGSLKFLPLQEGNESYRATQVSWKGGLKQEP